MTAAFIGLGANLGQPRKQVAQAIADIGRLPHTRVVRQSSFYRSAPLGHADQPDYVNAVAQVETDLPAEQLLAELQAIEHAHGRQRSFPDAPRTLDLDLLILGNCEIKSAHLQIPHPRMHERAFVLMPLVELDPQAIVPGRGTARELLEKCADQSIERIA